MNVLRSRFFQAVAIFVVAFVVLRFGIRPPAPWSVLSLYMFIISLALLIFVSSDRDSWRDFVYPIWLTLTDPRYRMLRSVIVVAVPLLLGYYAYTQAAARPQAPPELRAVHPAPPASIQFRGKEINIAGFDNPLRKDAAAFKKHVAAGGDDLHPQLRLLSRRQPGRQGSLRLRLQPAAGELPGSGHHRDAAGGLSVLAHRQGRPGPAQGVHAVELGRCRPGKIGSPRSRSGRSSCTCTTPPGSSRAGGRRSH